MRGVMVLVGKGLLFRKNDGNGRNAFALPIADRGGNAGNSIIRLARLDGQARLEGGGGRARKRARIDFGASGRRGTGAALEKLDTIVLRQVADEQAPGSCPVQRNT